MDGQPFNIKSYNTQLYWRIFNRCLLQ